MIGFDMPWYLRRLVILCLVAAMFPLPVWSQDILTWQDCLKEASQNNPELIIAHETIEQSEHSKSMVASALFPQLNVDASITSAESEKSGNARTSAYGISADQLLFDGFKTISNTRAAVENIKAARENYRFASSRLRWRLRTAFINLLRAQAFIEIAENIKDIRRKNLQLIALRYESGTEHRGALLTAQANVSQSEFEVRQAERNLQLARHQLSKELGRQEFVDIQVQEDLTIPPVISDQVPDFEILSSRHPEVLKSIVEKNAAAYDVQSSRAEFLPTVSLGAGATKNGIDWPPDEERSNVALRVSFPLFQGGLNAARLGQAKSTRRQLEAAERATRDEVLFGLQQAWSAVQDAVENISSQKMFLEASEERSKISQEQYSVGLISFDNWTIIEDDLVRQKKLFLNAQADAFLAQADWIQAKGETLEYEE